MKGQKMLAQREGTNYLVRNRADERFNIELRRTRLLARCVSTLKTTTSLKESTTLSQSGGFDVQEVSLKVAALEARVNNRTLIVTLNWKETQKAGEDGGDYSVAAIWLDEAALPVLLALIRFRRWLYFCISRDSGVKSKDLQEL